MVGRLFAPSALQPQPIYDVECQNHPRPTMSSNTDDDLGSTAAGAGAGAGAAARAGVSSGVIGGSDGGGGGDGGGAAATTAAQPRHPKKHSAEVVAAAKARYTQLQAARKVFELQPQLLQDDVTAAYLRKCALLFQPRHYDEMVEERATMRMCGYPLCKNRLLRTPGETRHQHGIDPVRRRIYDAKELAQFCSVQCFKVRVYLWARGGRREHMCVCVLQCPPCVLLSVHCCAGIQVLRAPAL